MNKETEKTVTLLGLEKEKRFAKSYVYLERLARKEKKQLKTVN